MMSSAASLWKLFRDQAERDSGTGLNLFGFIAGSLFTIIPESCSGSSWNSVRNHPGIAFTLDRIPQHLQAGFTTVPAGYRLVAQNVSATLTMEAAAAAPAGILQDSASSLSLALPGSAGTVNGAVRQGGFSTQILAYYDAGSTPSMLVVGDFPSGVFQFATLTGYLENCAIAGCPAIQR